MAEVSQRLGNGAFRLSALRNIACRPASNDENHGSLLANCNVSIIGPGTRGAKVRGPGICEYQRVSVSTRKEKDHRAHKRSRLRKCERRQENGTSPISWPAATSQDFLSLDRKPSIYLVQDGDFMQTHHTPLHLSPSVYPVPQVSLIMTGRMTCWNKQGPGVLIATTCHLETFRSPHQLRALSTIVLNLAEQGSRSSGEGLRLKLSKLKCGSQASTTARYYSWRGSSSTPDTPLHRSRTAYYDVLNVSPDATQSQIKTAYYKQSFIYHPDKNSGSAEATQRFSEINEAYTVLGNINLRRKYDRGILSQSDVQGAWRPSSRETASRTSGPQQQQRARRFSQGGGKTMFDFDAFFQAHYGEQLQREREMKARKQRFEEKQKKDFSKWKLDKLMEMTVGVLLATGGVIIFSIIKS